jgi:periplasmic protein TonB
MSNFQSCERISYRTWTAAALVATAMHLTCIVLAFAYLRDDAEPELGAPAIAIEIELSALRTATVDLPPGPDAEESVASAPVMQQMSTTELTALLREAPIETDDPELTVAPRETDEANDEPKPPLPINPSVETVAAQATALPSLENIPPSSRSITPEQGSGESPQRVRATWEKELIAHLDRHKRYPASHSLDNAELLVNLVVDETGRVLSSHIVRGSGDGSFDEAALAMITRSDPVPKPPALVVRQGLNFTLPVIFRVKKVN